jgi:hypothetical protein
LRVPEFRKMQRSRLAAGPWTGLFPTGALTYDVSGDVITVRGPKGKLRAWLRWRGGKMGGGAVAPIFVPSRGRADVAYAECALGKEGAAETPVVVFVREDEFPEYRAH